MGRVRASTTLHRADIMSGEEAKRVVIRAVP